MPINHCSLRRKADENSYLLTFTVILQIPVISFAIISPLNSALPSFSGQLPPSLPRSAQVSSPERCWWPGPRHPLGPMCSQISFLVIFNSCYMDLFVYLHPPPPSCDRSLQGTLLVPGASTQRHWVNISVDKNHRSHFFRLFFVWLDVRSQTWVGPHVYGA